MLKLNDEDFLLISSDIHDDEQIFEKLAQLASSPKCIAFLYAGDLNIENYFISSALQCRSFVFIPVAGNCDNPWSANDINLQLPLYRNCTFKNLKIFITHGHRYYDPNSVGLNNTDFDIIITGHSHKHSLTEQIEENKKLIYLNPGSPSKPRGDCIASYALIRFSQNSTIVETRRLDSDELLSQITIPAHK
ncbi:MAG: YfcE family phosphodiesterase [Sphaerochaetaceae bacterium]|nr:YfcE family phosphodiesterase [Sphaerochaetaceae bacterium]